MIREAIAIPIAVDHSRTSVTWRIDNNNTKKLRLIRIKLNGSPPKNHENIAPEAAIKTLSLKS